VGGLYNLQGGGTSKRVAQKMGSLSPKVVSSSCHHFSEKRITLSGENTVSSANNPLAQANFYIRTVITCGERAFSTQDGLSGGLPTIFTKSGMTININSTGIQSALPASQKAVFISTGCCTKVIIIKK
jgi:hypothetical protein